LQFNAYRQLRCLVRKCADFRDPLGNHQSGLWFLPLVMVSQVTGQVPLRGTKVPTPSGDSVNFFPEPIADFRAARCQAQRRITVVFIGFAAK
jgi:hypothetical protein